MLNNLNKEKIQLFLIDFLSINISWYLYYLIRIKSGWINYTIKPELWLPMLAIWVYWSVIFFFFHLYKSWYTQSRLDEIITILKATTFGTLLLSFIILIDDRNVESPVYTRFLILIYWFILTLCTTLGRLIYHSFKRSLLLRGYGLNNTLIIGWNEKAFEIFDLIKKYPALGHKIIGFVALEYKTSNSEYKDTKLLGEITNLPEIINKHNISDIIIALDSTRHEELLQIIASCNNKDIKLKIIPDLYDIISGQARTNQIYGFPLIEISPLLMKPWESFLKRSIDIIVSSFILIVGFPLWLIIGLAIKIDSRGPVFYLQERVGKDEKIFKIIKFRSMIENAEEESGPTWASKNDPRITRVGKILRRLRLDEIPQFINVLLGHMSLVGPRPERPYFVEELSKQIPLYKRRLRVKPGITGWAQVKHKYDESIEDVKKKLQYDIFYIENMSLRMDLKILFHTIAVVLLGKGH